MENIRRKKVTTWLLWVLILLAMALVACDSDETNTAADEAASSAEEAVTPGQSFAEDYTAFIEEVMAEENLPGTAVAVVRGDEIIFAEGFGYRDVQKGLPVTTDTLFHIGSTNKSITSMLIATLVDDGLFDWDTPVVEIYP
ncbi:MAG: beta-lactamase family protein, partial [Anaerolineales bacterium]|nr:beta-lactamase family protein [Anaerolineales bacterium]